MNNNSKQGDDVLLVDPMYLLAQEMKKKELKVSALASGTTISIALGVQRTREQLVPYLASIFVQQSNEIKKGIIKLLTQLLHQQYIGKPHHSCCILQIVIDILCVYSQKQIRDDAYGCLERVLSFMDVRRAQKLLLKTLHRLNQDALNEEEKEKNSSEINDNIRDLVLRMIPYIYMGVDTENEKQLLQILNSYKNSIKDLKMIGQVLRELIKVMPPIPQSYIRQLIELLIQKKQSSLNIVLIQPIILLTKISGEEETIGYLNKILEEADNKVVCACLKRLVQLTQVFSHENMKAVIMHIDNFENEPQQIKNTILEIVDNISIGQQTKTKILQPPSSMQLKNTLGQTLCRLHDSSSLAKLLQASDNNFKIKMFPQLPPINELHIDILCQILKNKTWRPKINILENVNKRTLEKENSTILIPTLFGFLNDKIAIIRSSVVISLSIILSENKVKLQSVYQLIIKASQSSNWFERQCVLRVVLESVKRNAFVDAQDRRILLQIIERGESDRVRNVLEIGREIREKLNDFNM